MDIAPTAYPIALVEELERLTRERESPPPEESHSSRDARQQRIDEVVAELKLYRSPRQGDTIAGTRLVRIVGKGNFGVVWQGVHEATGEPRAVKVFDFDRLGLGLSLYHFRRGVRAMEHLSRQAGIPATIIRLFEVDPTALAFAMAFVDGHDLVNIERRGWSLDKKTSVFKKTCEAVQFAHAHGVLHRDIKPANIVMTCDEEPVLTDFDIADLLFVKTLSCKASGTVAYAAPEQLMGRSRRDPTGDVFSLGRILHFLLIERDPDFAFEPVPTLDQMDTFPPGLVRIIRKCTMKVPEDRYQSVEELLADLSLAHEKPQSVGIGPSVVPSGDTVSELYEIIFNSGITYWFDIWDYHSPAQKLLASGSVDEVCYGEIEILKEKDRVRSITHGGPPYRLGPEQYDNLKSKFAELKSRLMEHLRRKHVSLEDIPGMAKAKRWRPPNRSPSSTPWGPRRRPKHSPSWTGSPTMVLREAIAAVPAVKWALGVGGIASVVAIVASFGLDFRVAVFGTLVTLVFMTILLLFARASTQTGSLLRLPALVLTWFALALFMAVSACLFLSVFFQWPVDLQTWLQPR